MAMAKKKKPEPPATMPYDEGDGDDYALINPEQCNPPLDGLFVSWDAARRIILRERTNKIATQLAIATAHGDRDIERARREHAERQLGEQMASASSWWTRWAFPIGLGVGLLGGVAAAIAAGGILK
jgi:hypothetical protein